MDFVELMRGFYDKNTEFKGVPLYIYGQSYGGKMAVDMGIRMHEVDNDSIQIRTYFFHLLFYFNRCLRIPIIVFVLG